MVDRYDIAQVCRNGHVINDSYTRYPASNKNYCAECGEQTLNNCQKCGSNIQGRFISEGFVDWDDFTPPSFCKDCGNPFPWIQDRVDAARELTEIMEFSEDDRKLIISSLDDLVRDTPRTQVAAVKFKKGLAKAGSTTVTAFRDILVDVLSETAKKALWPSS